MIVADKQYRHFGDYLRDKRTRAGLSQEKAALALGYSERHFLSRIENDRASLPFEKIPAVADLYGMPTWELAEAVIAEQTRILREKIGQIVEKNPAKQELNIFG